MSGYKGPRGPNVSQYIANLNQLSPPTENLTDPQPVTDDFSAFLNTDFFDINGGTSVDLNSPINFDVDFDVKTSPQATAESTPRHSISAANAKPNMDFNLNGKFVCRAVAQSLFGILSPRSISITMARSSSHELYCPITCAGGISARTTMYGQTPRLSSPAIHSEGELQPCH